MDSSMDDPTSSASETAVRLDVDWEELQQTIQNGLVSAAANTAAATTTIGLEGLGVRAAEFLLRLNCEEFAKDVIVHMARQGKESEAGKLNLAAINSDAGALVRRLSAALLCNDYTMEAAAITHAFWDAAMEADVPPDVAARAVAPAIVHAVDAGHVAAVASVQTELLRRDRPMLVMWLTVSVVKEEGRPDAVARGTLEVLRHPEGMRQAIDIAALTMVEGHHDVAATVAAEMHLLERQGNCLKGNTIESNTACERQKKWQVPAVVAGAAVQAVAVRQPQAVIKVSEILLERKRGDLLAAAVSEMVEAGNGAVVGVVTLTTLRAGKVTLAARLFAEMAAEGRLGTALSGAAATGRVALDGLWRGDSLPAITPEGPALDAETKKFKSKRYL